MKKRTAELILKDPEKFAHHDRVFLNNPVVMQGMGLAPLVVVATTGQNGLMLAGGFIVLGILCAIWRAAAAKRKEYLKREARDTLTVHYQKEGNREP